MLCLYFLCSNLEKLFDLTYIHPYPQHIVATYGYPKTYHVWKVSCLSYEWVRYIHAAYTTSSLPRSCCYSSYKSGGPDDSLRAVMLIQEQTWLNCA